VWPKNRIIGLLAGAILLLLPVHALANQVQSTICAPLTTPAITAPATATQTPQTSAHVVGTAQPGQVVTVYKNSVGSGAATTTNGGTFALEVPLNTGDNSLVAQVSDTCNTVRQSTAVVVKRTSTTMLQLTPATPTTATTPTPPTTPPAAPTASTPVASTPAAAPKPVVTSLASAPSTATAQAQQTIPAVIEPRNEPDTAVTEIQKDVVTNPKPGETIKNDQNQMWVKGKAQPLSVVAVYINAMIAAQVVADEAGSYSVLVDIKPGDNTVHVKATSQDGTQTTRVINIKLVKSTKSETAKPKSSNTTANIIIGSVAGGSALIMAGIYHEIHHIKLKDKAAKR